MKLQSFARIPLERRLSMNGAKMPQVVLPGTGIVSATSSSSPATLTLFILGLKLSPMLRRKQSSNPAHDKEIIMAFTGVHVTCILTENVKTTSLVRPLIWSETVAIGTTTRQAAI